MSRGEIAREVTLISFCGRSANVFWKMGRRLVGIVMRQKCAHSFEPDREIGVDKKIVIAVNSSVAYFLIHSMCDKSPLVTLI